MAGPQARLWSASLVLLLAGCGTGGKGTTTGGAAASGTTARPAAGRGVKFVGFDASRPLVRALKAGQLQGVVVQNPLKMGETCVKTLVAHLEGKTVEKKISTGETMATPENMGQAEVAALLDPPKVNNIEDANVSKGKSRKWKVMVIPKGTTHEFWQTIHAGARKAAEELGNVEILWQGPLKEDDRTDQIQMVQNAVALKVDGIVLAPLDAQALVVPVEQAIAAGIPVVVMDSALKSDKPISYVATDNYHGGVLGAERLAEVLGGKGRIILIRYMVGSASTEEREQGFMDAMKKYPEITYLTKDEYSGATADTALKASQNIVTRYRGEIDGIFCPNESSTSGMLKALKDAGMLAGKPVNEIPPRLSMRGVSKAFGASRALDGVSFDLSPGEVHALIGENGAGKSTLMKVLSGALLPDAGTMTLDGLPFAPRTPRDARRRGVAMIYQELTLAPHLSVEANVMLGQEQTRAGLIRRAEHRRLVRAALDQLEHPDIRPEAIAGTLSVGAQQLVEVARALVSDARVIVFDEPTSSLTEQDAARLFTLIDRLRARGLAIVYISHFLEEVRRVADRFTVLRDGRTVQSGAMAGMEMAAIIAAMVGRDLTELFPRVPRERGEPILDLSALEGRPLPRRADLTLHRGEVLGIAGLVGAGRTELLRVLFGLAPVKSGMVRIRGVASPHATPHGRIRQGLGLLSEDRKAEGLALGRSIEDNLTYSSLGRYARLGWLDLRRRRSAAAHWLEALHVRSTGPTQTIGGLSGGNQQKVALARLLHQEADVLLLDEPTRGIDVGSKAEIYRLIGELASRGKAVLVVSSYLPELFGLCDRLAVMSRGQLSPARPIADWTEHAVMEVATGG